MTYLKPALYVLFYLDSGIAYSCAQSANPNQEEIDKLHLRYIEDVKELYEKYKDKYHPTDRSELLIV